MNQERIGKFIAECRKKKNMTQLDLAEKLGVTDRSIGNWENARCMPDLSLFKPLCAELDITINELISGERIKKEDYQERLEENIINTIDYTNKKIRDKNNLLGVIMIIFGILLTLTAMTIFPSESSWGSIYSLFGLLLSFVGIFIFIRKLSHLKLVLLSISYFLISFIFLIAIDYIAVIIIKQPPRFSYLKETGDNVIIYHAPFYRVYRINYGKENEYYIIDTKSEYTSDTIPIMDKL